MNFSNNLKQVIESMSHYYNMDFTENQKKLIELMLNLDSESIIDFHGENAPDDYNIFLTNHRITPEKAIVINSILKSNKDLNPNTDIGFKKPELEKIQNDFYTNNIKLSSMPRRSSSHTMTTTTRSSINKRKSGSKTKKKKKKNKKKKRKSYKK